MAENQLQQGSPLTSEEDVKRWLNEIVNTPEEQQQLPKVLVDKIVNLHDKICKKGESWEKYKAEIEGIFSETKRNDLPGILQIGIQSVMAQAIERVRDPKILDLENDVQELKREKDHLVNQNERLKEDIDDNLEKINRLKSSLNDKNDTIKELKDEIKSLKEEKRELEKKIKEMDKEMQNLTKTISDLQISMQEKDKAMKKTIDDCTRQFEIVKDANEKLAKRNDSLEEKVDQMKTEMEESKKLTDNRRIVGEIVAVVVKSMYHFVHEKLPLANNYYNVSEIEKHMRRYKGRLEGEKAGAEQRWSQLKGMKYNRRSNRWPGGHRPTNIFRW